jgi:hypothetical protein
MDTFLFFLVSFSLCRVVKRVSNNLWRKHVDTAIASSQPIAKLTDIEPPALLNGINDFKV